MIKKILAGLVAAFVVAVTAACDAPKLNELLKGSSSTTPAPKDPLGCSTGSCDHSWGVGEGDGEVTVSVTCAGRKANLTVTGRELPPGSWWGGPLGKAMGAADTHKGSFQYETTVSTPDTLALGVSANGSTLWSHNYTPRCGDKP